MSHSKKVGGFEKMAAGAIIAMLLLAPTELSAGRRNGAWLRIEKSDGSMVEGELLKISGGTLFLFDKTVQRSVQVKMDEIDRLGKRNQRNVMGGIGAGCLVGIGAGLVLGKLCESREPCENVSVYMGSFVIGIPIGAASIAAVCRRDRRRALIQCAHCGPAWAQDLRTEDPARHKRVDANRLARKRRLVGKGRLKTGAAPRQISQRLVRNL